MKTFLRYFSALSFSAFALTSATNAFADCSTMNDDQWIELSSEMASAYDRGDYDEALRIGKQLTLICNRSPIVNFTISEIYRKTGNDQESDKYASRATDYIIEYPVPAALNERIWLRAAEVKLPYKKQAADLQQNLEKVENDLSVCNDANIILASNDSTLNQTIQENAIRSEYLLKESKRSWGAMMWSGVGITVAGIALTATGAALASTVDKVEKSGEATDKKSGYAITKPYITSWALLGAGIAMTVGGTVLTGIAGYHYTHIDLDNDGAKDESVSFNISPTSISFGMTF